MLQQSSTRRGAGSSILHDRCEQPRYDLNGDGVLSEAEMKIIFGKVGISEKDAESVFIAADTSKARPELESVGELQSSVLYFLFV